MRRREPWIALASLATVGCSGEALPAPPVSLPPLACPAEWVTTRAGGCAPAVIACAPAAGDAPPGCAAAWPVAPHAVADEDGVTGQNFFSLADGAVGGAWLRRDVPCPDGASRDDDGACPWAPTRANRTPSGVALPAEEECSAAVTVAGARYVDAAAPPGGDGSAGRPFASASAALAETTPGGTVVFAPGTYDLAPLAVTGPLSLRGSCARDVTLRFAGDGIAARGPAADLTLEGVTVEAAQRALAVEAGAALAATRAVIRGRRGVTLAVAGSRVSLARCEVESFDATVEGRAVVLSGGSLTARASALRAAGGNVLALSDRAGAELEDVAVAGPGTVDGVLAVGASTLTARRTRIEGGTASVLNVTEAATVRLDEVLVRGLSGSPNQSYRSGGLLVQRGATLEAREVVVEDVAPTGLAVRDAQTAVTIDGLVVRGVRAVYGSGRCVDVNDGARATLRRATLRGCHDSGLMVSEFARVELRDAAIRQVAPRPDGLFGFGVTVLSLAHLDARRVLLTGGAMGGLGAIGLPEPLLVRAGLADALRAFGELRTAVRLRDLIIRETAPLAAIGSFALVTAAGVTLQGERLALVDAPGVSVAVTPNGYPTEPFVRSLVSAGRIRPMVGDLLRRALPPNLDGPSTAQLTDVYVRQGPVWRVGFDAERMPQPELRASIGAYVATGCALDGARLTLEGGTAGEYGLSSLGTVRLDGLRVSGMRRCSFAVASGVPSALTDALLPAPSRCGTSALEIVRLPLSSE